MPHTHYMALTIPEQSGEEHGLQEDSCFHPGHNRTHHKLQGGSPEPVAETARLSTGWQLTLGACCVHEASFFPRTGNRTTLR